MSTEFCSENIKGKDHLEDLGENGRIIKTGSEIRCYCIDWIHMAQDGNQRRAFVNTVLKLLVP
jgi:hypothetical protein